MQNGAAAVENWQTLPKVTRHLSRDPEGVFLNLLSEILAQGKSTHTSVHKHLEQLYSRQPQTGSKEIRLNRIHICVAASVQNSRRDRCNLQ